jgi:dephospho-CoA kinase
MLRIGLTGGIGSGKSAVADEFRRLGAPVVDTDEIARELVAPGSDALNAIVATFGTDVLTDSGRLDRAALRTRAFASAGARRRLEAILHPRIRDTVKARLERVSAPYCIVVIPLLFETGFRDLVDRVLVVDASEPVRIERLLLSRELTRAEIESIMAAQVTQEQRRAGADDLIDNDGSREELGTKVAVLDRLYRRQNVHQ